MGSFYTNIQVRANDRDAVLKAVGAGNLLPAFVSEQKNGWVIVYPLVTESQSETDLKAAAAGLSKTLDTGAFGMLVHDSDIFMYVLAEHGAVIDEYNSDPGYFDGKNNGPSGGKIDSLLKYCVPGTTANDLQTLLHTKHNKTLAMAGFAFDLFVKKDLDKALANGVVFGGDTMMKAMAILLGVDGELAHLGYKYVRQGETDRSKFVLLKPAVETNTRTEKRPPRLLAQQHHQLSQIADPEVRQQYESYARHQRAEQCTVGEELNWCGTLINTGDGSCGMQLELSGSALEQKLFSTCAVTAECLRTTSDDDDYKDLESENSLVYSARLEPRPGTTRLYAELTDFPFEKEVLLRLPLLAATQGAGTLELAVTPSGHEPGENTATFTIEIVVSAAKPQATAVASSTIYPFADYELCVPDDFSTAADDGRVIEELEIPATVNAYKDEMELSISIQVYSRKESDKNKESASEILRTHMESVRTQMRFKSLTASAAHKRSCNGIEFDEVSWHVPSLRKLGFVSVGRSGENTSTIIIRVTARTDDELVRVRSIIDSLRHIDQTETELRPGVKRAKRNASNDESRPHRKRPGLSNSLLRLMLLYLFISLIAPKIPGVFVGDAVQVTILMCLVSPVILMILMSPIIILPALRPWRQKLSNIADGKLGIAGRIVAFFVGFILSTLLWSLIAFFFPHLLKFSSPVAVIYVSAANSLINQLRNLGLRSRD